MSLFQLLSSIGSVDSGASGKQDSPSALKDATGKVHLVSELSSFSKLIFYLRKSGGLSDEQGRAMVGLLVERVEHGLLCDCYRALDLEVELLAFSSWALNLGTH